MASSCSSRVYTLPIIVVIHQHSRLLLYCPAWSCPTISIVETNASWCDQKLDSWPLLTTSLPALTTQPTTSSNFQQLNQSQSMNLFFFQARLSQPVRPLISYFQRLLKLWFCTQTQKAHKYRNQSKNSSITLYLGFPVYIVALIFLFKITRTENYEQGCCK